MSTKLQEAKDHCKTAERLLKTTLLRWSPNYEAAADEYRLAAQAYRAARDVLKAKEYYLKASELYKRTNALFHAAKALDNAVLVSKEKTTPHEMLKLASEAANLYQQHGSIDSAAVVLDRVGRFLEAKSPQIAVNLFMQAADITANDKNQSCGEYLAKSAKLLVRLKSYDEALSCLARELVFNQECGTKGTGGRNVVVIVLIHLARSDVVGASKALKQWEKVVEDAEWRGLTELIKAFDDLDLDGARYALKSPFIRSLDVDFVRLTDVIQLPIPAKINKPVKAVRIDAKPVVPQSDEDEEAGPSTAQVQQPPVQETNLDDISDDEIEHLC